MAASILGVILARLCDFFFKLHVPKFIGIKNFAAFHTFHKFRIFRAGNYSNSRVFARNRHSFVAVSLHRPLGQIVSSLASLSK